jgi:small-conductance mechanosensitive channel
MTDIQSASEQLIRGISRAAVTQTPRLIVAVLFLVISSLVIRLSIRHIQARATEISDNPAHQRLLELCVRVTLWFAVFLVALSILGFQHLATALGTATGFLALAIAYALKDVLDEVIAGFYLITDDVFIEGQRVSADDETGVIEQVGIRRTVIRDTESNERTVIANNRIESKWTLHEQEQR